MPIRDIQQRHAEHGRIRIGRKVAMSGGKSRPEKLDRFRFTSGDRGHIKALAALYGGTVADWKNGTKAEFEVITDARSIPVIAYRNSISQWMETWSGGGCTHRCDGYHNVLTDEDCNPQDKAHRDAKPTTRLSVMLRDLESLGTWRLETHGWNAAAELPAMAELAAFVGDYVPARLVLQQRTSIKDGETNQFVVPVLDLAITKQRLNEVLAGTTTQAIGSTSSALQIEAARGDVDDLIDAIADATTRDALNAIWRQAGDTGRLTEDIKARIIAAGNDLPEPAASGVASTPAPEVVVNDDGTVDAEIVEDTSDLPALWQQVVAEAGSRGMGGNDLTAAAEKYTGGAIADMTPEQARGFLAALKAGEVQVAA